jgi:hypothetical protein
MQNYAQAQPEEYDPEGYVVSAADAPAAARVAFIKRTYAHLALAILAFIGLEAILLNLPNIDNLMLSFFGMGKFAWLLVLVVYMGGSWIAERWANSDASQGIQYLGLGLYIVVEAAIFLPILWICSTFAKFDGVILQAGLMTGCVAGGLMLAVLITKQDFSFLGPILSISFLVMFGVIIASIFIGFNLGLLFSFVMVALASGAILYHTSNVLHHYRTDQHVAASLSLFAAVALLFWYILQIFMRSRD